MKHSFWLGVCMLVGLVSQAQVERLQKSEVPEIGSYLYTFGVIDNWEKTYSEDSSIMYLGSTETRNFLFQCIVVKFREPLLADKTQLEELLISYLEYLKTTLEVTEGVGYGKGHENESGGVPHTGVLDYWKCADGDQVVVKGWIDSQILAVLYIRGRGEYPVYNEQDLFLNGFHFRKTP